MLKLKEQYLCKALDKFKELIHNGGLPKADILHFYDVFKYELARRGSDVDTKGWLTKKEVSKELGISTSTINRYVLKGILPRGKKILHQRSLVWNVDEVEQLKHMKLLKANN